MFANTQEFRREAIHFIKYGKYPDGIKYSSEWNEYWNEQFRRCLFGYKVGETYITGYHYFYLNFCPIMRVEENVVNVNLDLGDIQGLRSGERIEGFPDFWDLDYEYFHHVEKAAALGKHVVWLKPRGVGASFKAACLLARNYHLIPASFGYALANDKTFLIEDGILNKFLAMRRFLNKYTEFGKASDFKNSDTDMHWRASYKPQGTNEEEGYMSEVIGISLNNDWQKARGKRGKILLFEEGGKFPNLNKAWNVARESVEQGNIVYGTMIAFGTGGTEGADFEPLAKMFYEPDTYNILPCDNLWDEELAGTKCGFFNPAYQHIEFKDKDGNSQKGIAKEHFDKKRKLKEQSSDPLVLIQEKAENPYKPSEAIMSVNSSTLPSLEAREWRLKLIASGRGNLGTPGILEEFPDGVKFKPDDENPPLTSWKMKVGSNRTGCVVIYQRPLRVNEDIPKGLYYICHDPYDKDDSEGPSIGAAHVMMNINNIQAPGDRIVATYFGRPEGENSLDKYNENLFKLARYYNCRIGFENDRGDVIGYSKRMKLTSWLEPEFRLAYDDSLKSKANRKFGMHMGSGRNNLRKKTGDVYLGDWLRRKRGTGVDGKEMMNLHTIYCLSTLEEIENYNPEKGNFDRISSLRVGMYYQKELEYKGIKVKEQEDNINKKSLFKSKLFG